MSIMFKVISDRSHSILIILSTTEDKTTFNPSNFLIISTKYFPGIKTEPCFFIAKLGSLIVVITK